MSTKRIRHTAKFKFQIAVEAIKSDKTINQLASDHQLHPSQISQWKKQLLEQGSDIFATHLSKHQRDQNDRESSLYEQIGRLNMELDWLKKKLPQAAEQRHALVVPNHPQLSMRRQCQLLGVSRSTFYYQPATESEDNLHLIRQIDEQYMQTPFYGSRRMTEHLKRLGYHVNRKRIQRLMRLMGIEAIYPKPKVSASNSEHRIYPYLLRDYKVTASNEVWSADITYIPMNKGFMYLVAILDWYSRYVITWELSNSLAGQFCLDALHHALSGATPTIFNTDQGVQFTANAFTDTIEAAGIAMSMDSAGRAIDNIYIERFWRSVKYEDVYQKLYPTGQALFDGLTHYIRFYNHQRPHQSLDYATPAEVYFG